MLERENGHERTDSQTDIELLRALLFTKERQELRGLRTRLDDHTIRARDVSEVLAEALRLKTSADPNHELSQALTPALEHALRESVRKDARVLAEALYPVMGPAIRRSIYESIRAMIESFNQALAQGLSLRGLKWRIESLRTGRPFAELVLLHTLVFRVEQVFLIHRQTGILLHHLAISQVGIQDPDLVSGMLSAIREFMSVSFDTSPGESVNSLQVGDLQVWVEQGPEAVLACVIRGHPPQRLRFKMKETLESIHTVFGPALDRFEGDSSGFLSAGDTLSDCLESQADQEQPFRGRKYAYLVTAIVAAILIVLGATSFLDSRRLSKFVEALNNEPGIVVTSFSRQGGRYRIRGLRDPQAASPQTLVSKSGLDPKRIDFEWRPYLALDDVLIQERAIAQLQPPPSAYLSAHSGTLEVSGNCDDDWAARLHTVAPLIAGVERVDDSRLVVSGRLSRDTAALQSIVVLFPLGSPNIRDDQRSSLDRAIALIPGLLAEAERSHSAISIEILGHTDSTGTEAKNSQLSKQRADNIVRFFTQAHIPADLLKVRAAADTQPVRQEGTEDDRQFNRSVTFRVVVSGPAGEH